VTVHLSASGGGVDPDLRSRLSAVHASGDAHHPLARGR